MISIKDACKNTALTYRYDESQQLRVTSEWHRGAAAVDHRRECKALQADTPTAAKPVTAVTERQIFGLSHLLVLSLLFLCDIYWIIII